MIGNNLCDLQAITLKNMQANQKYSKFLITVSVLQFVRVHVGSSDPGPDLVFLTENRLNF